MIESMQRLPFVLLAGGFLLASGLPAGAAPVLDQVDTFQDGTVAAWSNGGTAPEPVNSATGGPAGAGDSFLTIGADGSGAAGRLTVFNRGQWAGDFLAAGIGQVEMELRNPTAVPLSIRIGLKSSAGPGAPGYASTLGFALPADNQWHHASFALDAAGLTAINSPAALAVFLTNVAEFRILHSAAPALTGDFVSGQLGIDNIRASASPVPLPAAAWLLGSAVLGMAGFGTRRSG